jgi:hypothetical protein
VDELATYIEEAFEFLRAARVGATASEHVQAKKDVATYTSLLVLFSACCVLMSVL